MSSVAQHQVLDVFHYARETVLNPISPLFDVEQQSLKPQYVKALKRIFVLCDHDTDGVLNDAELNEFQVKYFNASPLQPADMECLKRAVQERIRGVSDLGVTVDGFLCVHALFIENGRFATAWAVLRKFGNDVDLELKDDNVPVPDNHAPDQSSISQQSNRPEIDAKVSALQAKLDVQNTKLEEQNAKLEEQNKLIEEKRLLNQYCLSTLQSAGLTLPPAQNFARTMESASSAPMLQRILWSSQVCHKQQPHQSSQEQEQNDSVEVNAIS